MESTLKTIWLTTGFANFGVGELFMIAVGCLLLYLAIVKKFEPLLLVPIGFGAILSNIPMADMAGPAGPAGLHLSRRYRNRRVSDADLPGTGCADRFWRADRQPQDAAARGRSAVRHFPDPAGCAGAQFPAGFRFHAAGRGGNRHHRRRGRPDGDFPGLPPVAGTARRDRSGRLLLHGAGPDHPASHHEGADHQGPNARSSWSSYARFRNWRKSCSRW